MGCNVWQYFDGRSGTRDGRLGGHIMSKFSKAVIVMLLLLGSAYYWLLVNAGPSNVPARSFDIARLRKAADAMPGQKPTALEYTTVATRLVPGAALAAGTGLRKVWSGAMVWRIDTPRGGIVLDSGLSSADAKDLEFKHYDNQAEAMVGQWMEKAEHIVFTHEHIDHVGGFLDYPRFEAIAQKAIVSPKLAQGMTALWRENAGRLPEPRKLAPVEAIAPGVVLIQTPGHTQGSQMVYVRLQNGREYLFAGDTGSLASNIIETIPRSRLLTDWLVQEDRVATLGWLKGLGALVKKTPSLVIIPSHDPTFLDATAAQNGFAKADPRRTSARTN